jgi:glycosyltransferase involved in cell wall biosynthesis
MSNRLVAEELRTMKIAGQAADVVLSVVIPTKNRPEFVKRPIMAFAEFSAEVEVIVVDDHSEQACADVVSSLCMRHENCGYIRALDRSSASAARNLGFKLSQGAYVWFFDDDDEVFADTIACVLQRVKRTPMDNEILVLPMSVWCDARELERVDFSVAKPSYERQRTRGNVVNTSCAVFSRAVINTAGGWDENLSGGDDSDLFLRCSMFCEFSCLDTTPVRVNIGHRKRFSNQLVKQQKAKVQFLRKHWNHISLGLRLHYLLSIAILGPCFNGSLFYRIRYALKKRLARD